MDIIKIKNEQGEWETMTAFQGQPGEVPHFTIGTVAVGSNPSDAAATITGTRRDPILNLTIPKGATGEQGETGVYVGPSEPADPSVLIWLDTDAESASVVTSVNGQSGNVIINGVNSVNGQTGDVILATGVSSVNSKAGDVILTAVDIGSANISELWENVDPTVDFSAQILLMDLSDYDAVLIQSRYAKTTEIHAVNLIPVGCQGATAVKNTVNATLNGRGVIVAADQIQFTTGYTNGTAGVANAIPEKIYGLKGVTSI